MWYETNGTIVFVELEDEIQFLVKNPDAIEIKNFNYWLESHNVIIECE